MVNNQVGTGAHLAGELRPVCSDIKIMGQTEACPLDSSSLRKRPPALGFYPFLLFLTRQELALCRSQIFQIWENRIWGTL